MTPPTELHPAPGDLRTRLFHVIYGHDTPAGKGFDVALIGLILLSVLAVMFESVRTIRETWGPVLVVTEWAFTALFTIEYALRLYCVRNPLAYARSFFGIVDLLAILPTYLGLIVPEGRLLLVVRILRMLRVFRVLKLGEYIAEAIVIRRALSASRQKITVFLLGVLSLVVIIGTLMYVVEGEANGFTSIPRSVYWSIVTITTVGYGDIAPRTPLGQILAAIVMILGYSIIAVPTGIVTSEIADERRRRRSPRHCSTCDADGHLESARFCHQCGTRLESAAAAS